LFIIYVITITTAWIISSVRSILKLLDVDKTSASQVQAAITSKVKAKIIFTYKATQLHTAFSGAFVTGRAAVQPRRNTRTLTCASIQPHIAIVCQLNCLHLR